MADRSGHFDNAGKSGKRPRYREGEQHQLVGVEAREARCFRRGSHQPDFEAHDGAPKKYRDEHHDDERDDGARVQPARAFEKGANARCRIELGGSREVQAVRIAPWATHHIVQAKIGDVDQHEAGENFARAEIDATQCRYESVESPADRAKDEHPDQHPMADIGAVGADRKPASAHRANQELPLGADVPDVGDVAKRQTNCDHDQWRRFDRDLLQREGVGQRLDKVDVKRFQRILADDREQDRDS